jgi:Metal-dependent amidase/aminoacylase/carboxypeptidase
MPQDQHHYLPKIIQLRRELHANPELSGQEYKTVNRILQFAEKHGKSAQIETFGETGFAVIYQFPEPGKTIAIRCELDALPIQEENQFSYKSVNAGVSHKCGHDGHMAIVSGLIFWLEAQPIQKGKVILLFQPAEETGKGAQMLVHDNKFEALGIDYLFALHNIPKELINSIIITPKGFPPKCKVSS